MRILVLGGTAFVGRHIVEQALAAGHDVTLFNRGQTNGRLFPDLERRVGDREKSDLDSLSTGEWDAVVDVNGYIPRQVRESAALLAERVGTYCFISTGSVYASHADEETDEDSPLAELEGPEGEQFTDRTYGPLKVRCEQAVLEAYPGRSLIVRPGIVAGPHDGSERYTYWVRRAARGGRMLGAARPDQPVQVVHAADQGRFVVDLVAGKQTGVFNSVGPDQVATFMDMVKACATAAGTEIDVVCAESRIPLPFALPANGRYDGVFRRSTARAVAAGLSNRSLVELAEDTLAWDRSRPSGTSDDKMPSAAAEAEELARHAR